MIICNGFPGIWKRINRHQIDGQLHAMPTITPRYVLVCDQVRQENNGKFIAIGLYTPDVVVAAIPASLPSLAFLVAFDTDEPGNLTFSFQLSHLGNVLAGGSGGANVVRAGTVVLPLNLGTIQFMSAGVYTFSLQIAGRAEPISTNFSVRLNLPAHAVPTPPPQAVQ